jgi:transcriptional regulator with XRE-family HTH domain
MKTDGAHTFGQILREARESKDFTLGQAATLLGVPKTSHWRWESGKTKVYAQQLVDIAAAYGLSVSAIIEGKIMIAPTQRRCALRWLRFCALKPPVFLKPRAVNLIRPDTTGWCRVF